MSDKILKALMQLFAILGSANDGGAQSSRRIVLQFLQQLLNSEQVEGYINLFDQFLNTHVNKDEGEKKIKRTSVSSVKVLLICEQINQELNQRQKIIVLLRLIEVIQADHQATEQELDFIETVYSSFNISEEEYTFIYHFVTQSDEIDSENILLISQQANPTKHKSRFLLADHINGKIYVGFIPSVGLYLMKYNDKLELILNGQGISENKIYQLNPGSSIRGKTISTVYYSDIVSCFLNDRIEFPLSYKVEKVVYDFPDGLRGLHELSFEENSGKLIGIMGGSGAGKSTLLNILNGVEAPTEGSVSINGYNLHSDKKMLEGIIGFVSQDDLLMEDLTVYQNLFFNAELCFSNLSKEDVEARVEQTLNNLGLYEIRHLKVGSPLDKIISGGQRKRLNIALELIREPSVLFVDEPTSGLSSRDSEIIIDLLKELALTGKLVFVVIHQPSSDIFKVFDKLLILDKGGYPVYMGNPVEAVSYFKRAVNFINPDEKECITCGNVNPEQVFNIIETRVLDENGLPTNKRKVSPKEWNKLFIDTIPFNGNSDSKEKIALNNTFKKPSWWKQFVVFTKRDVYSKLANQQYLAINILEAPLLAFILSFMTRYQLRGQDYTLYENKNLVAYLFMSVVVALFLGLTVSAEEIFKDRKIRKRERFLNLSKGSYLLSKTLILLFISAFQTALFVLIGNTIIGIHELNFFYWLMLFSVSLFANILGLNISSAFKSAVTIYIIIPFLIIPQLLLSGVLVKFDELNPKLASQSVVPLSGEIMVSRWAFEGLAIKQFTENSYQKNFYSLDKEIAQASYFKGVWFSKMNELLSDKKEPLNSFYIVRNELERYADVMGLTQIPEDKKDAEAALQSFRKKQMARFNELNEQRDALVSSLTGSGDGARNLIESRNRFHNKRLEELVTNTNTLSDPVFEENMFLHPAQNQIYFNGSDSRNIRAHFYAPEKYLFGHYVNSFWVNLLVVNLMSVLLWIMLYFEWLKRFMDRIEKSVKNFKRKS
jgi:ABC transport system ATP-binding/permease protein